MQADSEARPAAVVGVFDRGANVAVGRPTVPTAGARSRVVAKAATARMVSVRIPVGDDRPPRLHLATPVPAIDDPLDDPVDYPFLHQAAPAFQGPIRPSIPARPGGPVSLLARSQLADAHRGLDRSMQAGDIADRYAAAHLGALRGAAALLATRPKPTARALKHASVWVLMAKVAPELEEWANYFAAGSAKRKAAEAGITRLISDQDATEMVRQTSDFLEVIEQLIQH